jgi:hypothetical protein
MKLSLVNFHSTNLSTPKTRKVLNDNFSLEQFDESKTYDKKSTVFVATAYQFNKFKNIITRLSDNGYKIVLEALHEVDFGLEKYSFPTGSNILTMTGGTESGNDIHVPMFFWYGTGNFCPQYIDVGRIVRNRKNNFNKKFLMMMHGSRPFRDQIFDKFGDILDQSYHSYYARGIKIFNDNVYSDTPQTMSQWLRYVNFDWYNFTEFSVVVETHMVTSSIFITEKTMKALAVKHPFLILGNKNSLQLIKSNGFETFENLFDESYDLMDDYTDRINSVYTQVKNYNRNGYDNLTINKLEHNFNWFHNDAEIARRFKLDVIDPILEFVNAKT